MLKNAVFLGLAATTAYAQCSSNPTGFAEFAASNTCTSTQDYDEFCTTSGPACGYCDFDCNLGYTASGRAECKSGSWVADGNAVPNILSCVPIACPSHSIGQGAGADCTCEDGYTGAISWASSLNHYVGECVSGDAPICQGSGFNTYFVCDNSGSVGSQMKMGGTDFVERMIHSLWDQPQALFDIVYFDSRSFDILSPPTNDRAKINASIDVMRGKNSGSSTYVDEGLHSAKREMEKIICPVWQGQQDPDSGWFNTPRSGQDRLDCLNEAATDGRPVPTSVVFLITDGATSNLNGAKYEADDIKAYGGYLFTIAMAGADDAQLSQLRSEPAELFNKPVSDYSKLVDISDSLLNEFCIDITDVDLRAYACIENNTLSQRYVNFTVHGHGFDAPYVKNPQHLCRLGPHTVQGFPYPLSDPKSNYEMICQFDFELLPKVNGSFMTKYEYDFEISVDGISYTLTNSTVTLQVDPVCPLPIVLPPDEPVDSSAVIGGVVGGLLLLLFLLWCLWPLLFGVAVVAKKAAPIPAASTVVAAPKPAPAPVAAAPAAAVPATTTKKWKTVDTSSYIWDTGGGGAAPVHTQWGELGATGSAPTLNAKTSEVDVEVPIEPEPAAVAAAPAPATPAPDAAKFQPEGKSCCDILTMKCCACYACCAAMRPGMPKQEASSDGKNIEMNKI